MTRPASLILILLGFGLFYTFTSPQYTGAKSLVTRAAEYRDVIDNVSRIAEARDNLLTSYETIPVIEKARLFKALPDNIDAVGLSRDIDTIASQYGIAVKSVQIENNTDPNADLIVLPEFEKPYGQALVSFSFVSDYPNFIKFLGDLEKSLRIMDVKSVTFRTGETALYEHKVVVETYWLK